GVEAGAIEAAAAAGIGEIAEVRSGNRRWIGLRAASEGIGGVITLDRIGAERAIVCFGAGDFVMPVRASGEFPTGIRAEIFKIVDGVQAGRRDQGLAGDAGLTRVVAKGEAKLIFVAEGVAEISRKSAIAKGIIRPLALGLK